jgi:hypothetical protein
MWAIYKVNMLRKMSSGAFAKDIDGFAISFADEFDACMKRGGDLINGCNVVNGNKQALILGVKDALKKGQSAGIGNFNLLNELGPAIIAYWSGATLSPYPNPLVKPGGWQATPPAIGTVLNLGPEPIQTAASAAKIAAEKTATKIAIDELKKQKINIPPLGEVNIYDTVEKILAKKINDPQVLAHPAIYPAVLLVKLARETKIPSPNLALKPGNFIKFPPLPDRKKLIEEAKKKLEEEAEKQIKEQIKKQIIEPVKEAILTPIEQTIEQAIAIANTVRPLPTKAQIKKYVKDTFDGIIPDLQLPGITIPKIPTKEEIEKIVTDIIAGYIPNFNIVLPSLYFKPSSNILINPLVNYCKTQMLTTGGIINVLAQYPPPIIPGPAIIKWDGYRVPDGPPVPDVPIPPAFPSNIPLPDTSKLITELPKIELKAPKFEVPPLDKIGNIISI